MTGPEKDLLTAAFREVMSGVATPVSVVTAMDDGRPHGTTVSAFSSLSMQPPMVLVALDRRSELLGLITSSLRFGINVLGGGQSALALAFARKGALGSSPACPGRWTAASRGCSVHPAGWPARPPISSAGVTM